MPDVIARFEFHADRAVEFSPEGTVFVEQRYNDVDELIADCNQFNEAIVDVTAIVNGQVISLSAQPAE